MVKSDEMTNGLLDFSLSANFRGQAQMGKVWIST